MNLPPSKEVLVPAWVEVHGERYRIAAMNCVHCENTFFCPVHPEFIPRFCPYCGRLFKYFRDGTGDIFKDLGGRPL